MDLNFKPLNNDEDFFVPIRPGAEAAKVERIALPEGDGKTARYSFYVDLSDVSSAEAQDYLRRMRDELNKHRFKRPDAPPPG